jgi:hypothetical protein
MKLSEDIKLMESVLGECKHYQDTKHGTLGAVNPFSGKCCICNRQVIGESNEAKRSEDM